MRRKEPSQRSVGLCHRHVRGFSDSFGTRVLRSSHPASSIAPVLCRERHPRRELVELRFTRGCTITLRTSTVSACAELVQPATACLTRGEVPMDKDKVVLELTRSEALATWEALHAAHRFLT